MRCAQLISFITRRAYASTLAAIVASTLAVMVILCGANTSYAQRWSVGLSYGYPSYHNHPHHRAWYPYYYRPYPWYVETYPPPVIVRPGPVIVRPSPIIVQEPATLPSSVVSNSIAPVAGTWTATSETALQQLTHPDDNVRQSAVTELGRMKADRAADSLAATLAGDRSPIVRDAAARALGLIASPRARCPHSRTPLNPTVIAMSAAALSFPSK